MASTNVPIIPPLPPGAAQAGTNSATELMPIKGPVPIQSYWLYLWIALTVVAAILAFVWWKKRKRKGMVLPVIPPVPPHILARRRLEEALRLIGDPRAFTFATSDAVRGYLEDFFNLHAPERTTEEFLVELQGSSSLALEQKKLLGDFLVECDLVKFAGHEPTETALRELHKSAVKLVEETSAPKLTEPAPNV